VSYYLDTSAALKLYVDEPGSNWLRTQVSSVTALLSCWLLVIEITSAFNRRVREGSLDLRDYARIRDIFREDCRTLYQIIPLTNAVVDRACELLERHPLRSYDAAHLAAALVAKESMQRRALPSLIFLSADDRLNDIALAEGLAVINPVMQPL
jgi:predicted nucleic acid-binding protein